MARVVLLQRVVPGYRLPIYRRLADELGWELVYGRNVAGNNIELAGREAFLHGVDFKRWASNGSTRYVVPVGEILRRFRPQAIVAEGALGMTSTWELGLRRAIGGPKLLFWTIGYHPERRAVHGLGRLRQWPYLMAYASADALVLYGQDGADILKRAFPRKPMFVASNTIDVEKLAEHRDAATAAPRIGHPELISIGRLNANKDFIGLVKSFLLFRRAFPQATLRILGDGPDRAGIEAAAGDQLGKSVHLFGASFDEAETARYMLAADMFVMTGRIGLSINHALAYDLPVVAFARGPNGPFHGSEILYLVDGQTGFVATDVSVEGFAHRLEEIFASGRDWKAEMRAGIRTFVRERLVIDRMLDGFRGADAFIHA